MSHLQGSDYVGSMVVTEDALPKKSDYRRFRIKDVDGNDDFAAMEEVLRRRLTAYLAERDKPVSERPNKFAYPPQLLLRRRRQGPARRRPQGGHRARAHRRDPGRVAREAASRRCTCPARPTRSASPRQSEALYLLQRLRDESHRFRGHLPPPAPRQERMTRSDLDDVDGLGPVRRKRLVHEMGGIRKLRAATLERAHGR